MPKLTNKPLFIFAMTCSLLSFSSVSFADSTITLSTGSGNATLLVKNGRLLVKSNDPENTAYIQDITVNEVIFDTSEQTLYIIDHNERTVSPLTKANIEQFGKTIQAATGVLDAMPSEQRDTLAGLMRGFGIDVPESQPSTALQLTSLAEQQFRGITCQENSVLEDNIELGRVCITNANSTPLTNQDYETLLNAQAFFLLLAKQAQPFAEQYGQSIPNLDGIDLSGLVVYSNQTQVDPDTPPVSFVVNAIDLLEIAEIALPADYQSRPLFFTN